MKALGSIPLEHAGAPSCRKAEDGEGGDCGGGSPTLPWLAVTASGWCCLARSLHACMHVAFEAGTCGMMIRALAQVMDCLPNLVLEEYA